MSDSAIAEIDELLDVLNGPIHLGNRLLYNARIAIAIAPHRHWTSGVVEQKIARTNPRKIVTTYRQSDGSLSYGTAWAPEWIEDADKALTFIRQSFPHARLTIHTPCDLDEAVVTAEADIGHARMSTFGPTLAQAVIGAALMLIRNRLTDRT
ncbi:hypothetical protein HOU03_gp262 [Caulobacter phage CcrSC]|uniref:Uncharacterized protein n=1 Tax=Caulobacter phage CcrSC TaxID=2283272 RepID=A0A385EEB2_9CAUD|nr:hypothetical protein HOU03_gp262 [Caulobacter phage CcrSC]AXQ70006.1 hypothetical protein CcrSC_gp424 [Caulobacter phage CcrSC]